MGEEKQLNIFDYAISMEKQGITFYTRISDKFQDRDLKEMFQKLAREEANHIETFQKLKEKAEKKGGIAPFVIEGRDIDDYVQSLLAEGIFPSQEQLEEQIQSVDSPATACALAMEAEKNAILLYTELILYSQDKDQRKALEKILKEEKSHLVMLKQLRANHDPKYAAMTFGRFF